MTRPGQHSRQAFTLVECLVVVAIVIVLAALGAAGIMRFKEHAYATQSIANLRQLAAANATFASDHGHYAPADDRWNNRRWHGARAGAGAPFDPTGGFLAEYLGRSRRVTACPLFTGMLEGARSFEDGTGGYGYNAAYVGGLPGGQWNPDGTRRSERPSRILDPAATVMFTTTAYARNNGLQEYPYCEPPFWDFGNGPSGHRPSPTVHFRFNGKALVAWCDGHVTMESPADRPEGTNPHGGHASQHNLGWFGPDDQNGYWNPRRSPRAGR